MPRKLTRNYLLKPGSSAQAELKPGNLTDPELREHLGPNFVTIEAQGGRTITYIPQSDGEPNSRAMELIAQHAEWKTLVGMVSIAGPAIFSVVKQQRDES